MDLLLSAAVQFAHSSLLHTLCLSTIGNLFKHRQVAMELLQSSTLAQFVTAHMHSVGPVGMADA